MSTTYRKRKRTAKARSSTSNVRRKLFNGDAYSRLNTVRSLNSPVASKLITRLKYHTSSTMGPGLPVGDYIWRLNSLFDPDVIVAGHQPMGFDQIAGLYGKYKVFKCSYKIMVASAINSGLIGVTACAVPTNTATAIANGTDAQEMRASKWGYTCAQLGPPIYLYGMVDLPTLNGKTRAEYAGDDLCGAIVSANPSEVLDLHLVIASSDLTTNVQASLAATLTYYVEFSDPVQLAQS